MNTALYIFAGIFTAAVIGIFAIVLLSVVQQRRTPLPKRIEQVRQKLRDSETPTGATSLLSGYRVGVSDDMVREVAEAEGYQWTGYTGLNDRRLNFQRALPKHG